MNATEFKPFTAQIVVEVRYARGIVYLDKCGSLMLALQDTLGEPFRPANLADIRHADIVSDAERIVVRFGPDRMSYTQVGPETAARCEKLASDAWKVVSDSLKVDREVTRCGVRTQYTWPTDTIEDARSRLMDSGLVTQSHEWSRLFGDSTWSSHVGVYENPRGGGLRVQLDPIQHKVEGLLPAGRERFAPPSGIQFDLDRWHDTDNADRYALGAGQLRDFIRRSWNDFKRLRTDLGARLFKEGTDVTNQPR